MTHGVVADGGARLILASTLKSPKLHILGYHYMVIGLWISSILSHSMADIGLR